MNVVATANETALGTTAQEFPEVSLSARERIAFALYASGYTMSEVAARMEVGETSVQTYIKRVRRKYLDAGVHLANKVDLHRAARAAALI